MPSAFYFLGFVFVSLASNTFADSPGIPAHREPHKDYRELAKRWLHSGPDSRTRTSRALGSSAYDKAVPYGELTISKIANWQSALSPIEVFAWIRDHRGVRHSGEMRRLSWLYPDDGCFARAELASQELESRFFLKPSKLFIFGNLKVKTPNSPSGEISWWYHVVPAFRSKNRIFVFDPAIQPQRPLLLEEWIKSMDQTLSDDFTLSICHPHTYTPDSDCGDPEVDDRALADQATYLNAEESQLSALGLNPERALKDLPPWRSKDEKKFICSLDPTCQLSRVDSEKQKN